MELFLSVKTFPEFDFLSGEGGRSGSGVPARAGLIMLNCLEIRRCFRREFFS